MEAVLATAARERIMSVCAAMLTLFSLPVSLAGLQAGRSGVTGGTITLAVLLEGTLIPSLGSSLGLSPAPAPGVRGPGPSELSGSFATGLGHWPSGSTSVVGLLGAFITELAHLVCSCFGSFTGAPTEKAFLLFEDVPCFLVSSCSEAMVFSFRKPPFCCPFDSFEVSGFFCLSTSLHNSFSLLAVALWKDSSTISVGEAFFSNWVSFMAVCRLLAVSDLDKILGKGGLSLSLLRALLEGGFKVEDTRGDSRLGNEMSFLSLFWDATLWFVPCVFATGEVMPSKHSTRLWLSNGLLVGTMLSNEKGTVISSNFFPKSVAIFLSDTSVLQSEEIHFKQYKEILVRHFSSADI